MANVFIRRNPTCNLKFIIKPLPKDTGLFKIPETWEAHSSKFGPVIKRPVRKDEIFMIAVDVDPELDYQVYASADIFAGLEAKLPQVVRDSVTLQELEKPFCPTDVVSHAKRIIMEWDSYEEMRADQGNPADIIIRCRSDSALRTLGIPPYRFGSFVDCIQELAASLTYSVDITHFEMIPRQRKEIVLFLIDLAEYLVNSEVQDIHENRLPSHISQPLPSGMESSDPKGSVEKFMFVRDQLSKIDFRWTKVKLTEHFEKFHCQHSLLHFRAIARLPVTLCSNKAPCVSIFRNAIQDRLVIL